MRTPNGLTEPYIGVVCMFVYSFQARRLAVAATRFGVDLNHTTALQLVAISYGYRDYSELVAFFHSTVLPAWIPEEWGERLEPGLESFGISVTRDMAISLISTAYVLTRDEGVEVIAEILPSSIKTQFIETQKNMSGSFDIVLRYGRKPAIEWDSDNDNRRMYLEFEEKQLESGLRRV